jgi:hypothetical protein
MLNYVARPEVSGSEAIAARILNSGRVHGLSKGGLRVFAYFIRADVRNKRYCF